MPASGIDNVREYITIYECARHAIVCACPLDAHAH